MGGGGLARAHTGWPGTSTAERRHLPRTPLDWLGSTGSGCGGESEVDEGGTAGRCGVAAGQDERPGSLVRAAGGLERGRDGAQALVIAVEQRGGTVEDGGGDGVPGDDRPGHSEMVAGLGVAGQHGGFGAQGEVPVQPYPEPLVRLVGLDPEPFQGERGLSAMEQGNGVEGGAVAGSAFGGDAQLAENGEPFRSAGVVAAQAVDHRDRGGGRAEAGCAWA